MDPHCAPNAPDGQSRPGEAPVTAAVLLALSVGHDQLLECQGKAAASRFQAGGMCA